MNHTARALSHLFLLAATVALPVSARAEFVERTAEKGLTWFQSTWGGAMADIDQDGNLDIYAGHHDGTPILFWNIGGGSFNTWAHPQPWFGPIDRHGVMTVSLDSDADPEILILHGGQGGGGLEANELYRNDGGSIFSLPGSAGLDDPIGRGRCASAADYNGDGRIDVWIGKAPYATSPNGLFRNDGPLLFTDVGAAAGLDEVLGTVGGLWGDYDDDGDPDLLVGGEEFPRPTVLWRNDDGAFVDASSVFSPPLPVLSGADWGDYDNDGDLDLAACDGQLGIFDAVHVANPVVYFFNTRFAENGIDGITIESVADTATAEFRFRGWTDTTRVFLGPSEVLAPFGTITLTDEYVGPPLFNQGVDRGTWVWRSWPGGPWVIRCSTPFTNSDVFDGWLQQKTQTTGVTTHGLEDPNFTAGAPHIWRNDGGTFVEVSAELGLPASVVNPRDISWVDIDNDGNLDLHLVDKGTSASPNGPDKIFLNLGASFVDVTSAEKIWGGTTGLADGALWGDTDGDGDVDLYLLEGAGPLFYSMFSPPKYYVNEGSRGPSIQIDLIGTLSGGAAVGTRVTAVTASGRVYRRVQANSWQGFMDPLRIHIGLDGESSADSVIVEWTSGATDVYTDMPDGIWTLTESNPTAAPATSGAPATAAWGVSALAPQPARGGQRLRLTAARPVRLTVTIHDVSGRRVRSLHDEEIAAGVQELNWDGRGEDGRPVTAGVYFVRVTDGKTRVTRKSTRLR